MRGFFNDTPKIETNLSLANLLNGALLAFSLSGKSPHRFKLHPHPGMVIPLALPAAWAAEYNRAKYGAHINLSAKVR
jgi:hypothetical protein